jgi:hypothetical protein
MKGMNQVSKPLRRTTAGAIAGALAALTIASPATAGEQVKTKIKLQKLTASKAGGTVSSKKRACEARRKVTLVLVDDYGPAKVAKTRTKSDGAWKVKGDFAPGIYFAKVKKASADGVECKGASSRDKTLDD